MIKSDSVPKEYQDIDYHILRYLLDELTTDMWGWAAISISDFNDPVTFWTANTTPTKLAALHIQSDVSPYKLVIWVSRGSVKMTYDQEGLDFNPARIKTFDLADPTCLDSAIRVIQHYFNDGRSPGYQTDESLPAS